jgi:hypothetical protein
MIMAAADRHSPLRRVRGFGSHRSFSSSRGAVRFCAMSFDSLTAAVNRSKLSEKNLIGRGDTTSGPQVRDQTGDEKIQQLQRV